MLEPETGIPQRRRRGASSSVPVPPPRRSGNIHWRGPLDTSKVTVAVGFRRTDLAGACTCLRWVNSYCSVQPPSVRLSNRAGRRPVDRGATDHRDAVALRPGHGRGHGAANSASSPAIGRRRWGWHLLAHSHRTTRFSVFQRCPSPPGIGLAWVTVSHHVGIGISSAGRRFTQDPPPTSTASSRPRAPPRRAPRRTDLTPGRLTSGCTGARRQSTTARVSRFRREPLPGRTALPSQRRGADFQSGRQAATARSWTDRIEPSSLVADALTVGRSPTSGLKSNPETAQEGPGDPRERRAAVVRIPGLAGQGRHGRQEATASGVSACLGHSAGQHLEGRPGPRDIAAGGRRRARLDLFR